MNCRVCKKKAVIAIPRHNTAFCADCFDKYLMDQVRKTIKEFRMFEPGDRILLAVSGGKDSLALWEILKRLELDVLGYHLDLGISEYSKESTEKTRAFAEKRGYPLIIEEIESETGATLPVIAESTKRPPCSACGLSKRHLFNRAARQHGCQVLATGHNLDDEASRLLGNILHWQDGYLEKQSPSLPAEGGLIRKVKPLNRLTEKEMATYAYLKGIDYVIRECPMSADAKQIFYKKVLNDIEKESPGTKQFFYFGFLERLEKMFPPSSENAPPAGSCKVCQEPCYTDICSFCRLRMKLSPFPETQETAESSINFITPNTH
ncbi:ATP-binding protein [Leptospirillum ferrooxidans]|jgi:uncharacterized protein (TIGR00269 family)|uniref:Putative ATPase, PPloop superfamily n=1 Tax=Leptospirillum ferrooxidans (strain C2-3) TaxID=1162668 RepID=I0ILM7_LEPFC|nr:ATP-binding protein [Leptospirillum ferrooxidans]BAM06176.1 putative ATPase, PPloop superfamily [Leptospirillum ferrooxidans C2-3]